MLGDSVTIQPKSGIREWTPLQCSLSQVNTIPSGGPMDWCPLHPSILILTGICATPWAPWQPFPTYSRGGISAILFVSLVSPHTVGSQSVAMFGCFELIATQRLLEWKSHLALVRWITVKDLILALYQWFIHKIWMSNCRDMSLLIRSTHCNAFWAFTWKMNS